MLTNRYAGMAIGEHLGYVSTSIWTFLVALTLWKVALVKPWWSILGMATALDVLIGMFEMVGWESAGLINAISYLMWSVWLVAVGIIMLRGHLSRSPVLAQPII